MSDHAHSAEHPAGSAVVHHGGQPAEYHGPSTADYLKVGAILAAVTILEVAIYYVEQLKPVLPWLLISLSAFKFAMVAAYFMHLRHDSRLFSFFFLFGLLLAGSIVLAFMTLFGAFARIPLVHPGGH